MRQNLSQTTLLFGENAIVYPISQIGLLKSRKYKSKSKLSAMEKLFLFKI
jgi:hypothetical protein